MGLIFFVSGQPTVPSVPGRWDLLVKKTMHVLAYAILTWLYLRALADRQRRDDGTWMRAVSAGIALLYALSDEYHQTFVPGRHGSLVDVAIDGIGVIGVILLDGACRSEWRPGGGEACG